MIKFENTEVVGWEHAIRGMRNPKNSWDKSDSSFWHDPDCGEVYDCTKCDSFIDCKHIGKADHDLMMRLAKAGTVHSKYRRMIVVYVDITAPLYWWKEFDTYKVGTVTNSCSTMHKIHEKEFTLDDFSCEHLSKHSVGNLLATIEVLNGYRNGFVVEKNKEYWWQMIQLLPSSYNQKRTVMMNYEVLANIYKPDCRLHHKLDEWSLEGGGFCKWIETLPYSEIITGVE